MRPSRIRDLKMKRVLINLVTVIILFVGCSKNDDPILEDASLKGTYYSAFAYTGGGYSFMGVWIDSYDVYWSYRFIDDNKAERTANKKEPYGKLIGQPEPYTYRYKYPDITLIDKDGKETNGTFIDKNVFRIGDKNYQKR